MERRKVVVDEGAHGTAFRRVMDPKTCEEYFEASNEAAILIKATGDEERETLNRPVMKVCMTKQEIKD
jgi:hypothetical protein